MVQATSRPTRLPPYTITGIADLTPVGTLIGPFADSRYVLDRPIDGGYRCGILFDPGADLSGIDAKIAEAATERWGNARFVHNPIKAGHFDRREGCHGRMLLRCSAGGSAESPHGLVMPKILDASYAPVDSSFRITSGTRAALAIQFCAYNSSYPIKGSRDANGKPLRRGVAMMLKAVILEQP